MALSPVGLRYTTTGIRPFLASLTSARRAIGGLSASGAGISSTLGSLGRQAQTAGLGLTFMASVPIVTALGSAVKAASQFEDELIKLNTLSGLNQQEIEGIRQGILSLAPALGKVPTELAEAAFFITSTGDLRNAAAALEVLEVSAKASAIGLGETKVVAGAVTSVLAAYGFEASEAGRVTDTLTAAVDRGKFEAEQFAPAIGRVLGLSAELGVSFEEASNFIATYTLSGLTASQATTSLQRVLVSIQKPTKAAEAALNKVGLSLETIQQAVRDRGLTATLLDMRDAFDAAGVPLSEFFTRVTGLTGVLFNTGEAADLFVENLRHIEGSAGIVERGFATVQQSVSFQANQLKASMGVLGTTIGSVLIPALNAALARIIPFVIAISDFAAQNPKLVLIATGFALMAAALGPLLLTFGFAISTFTSIIGIIGTLASTMLTLIPPIGLIVAAFLSLGAIITSVVQHRFREANMTFADFAERALVWGKNITVNLARGLIAGAVAVVKALIQIGQVIASWLAPGSPPKLLPDLPSWGASAMSEFLNGFSAADFSVFNTLAGRIEQFMRALAPTDDVNLVPGIMSVREIIAQIITDVGQLGVVNDGVIRSIVEGYGIAAGAAQDYIVTILQLAEAQQLIADIQEEINAVNEEFDANTAPINEELEAIEDYRDAIREQQRIDELQSIIDDPTSSALARELALLELREIELQNQLELEEEARDLALEALEAELEAAQEQAAALEEQAAQQEALIAAQEHQNSLLQEQAALLERLAEELSNVADAIGGAGGVGDIGGSLGDLVGGGLLDELDMEDLLGEGFTNIGEGIKNSITDLVSEITGELAAPLSELGALWLELGETWSTTFDLMLVRLGELRDEAIRIWGLIAAFFQEHGDTILNVVLGIVAAIGSFFALQGVVTIIGGITSAFAFLSSIGGVTGIIWALAGAIDAVIASIGIFVAAIGGPVTLVIAAIAAVIGLFVVAWRENWFNIQGAVETFRIWWVGTAWPAITGALQTAWDFISGVFNNIVTWISTNIIPVIISLRDWWSGVWQSITIATTNMWNIASAVFAEILRWIQHNIMPWVRFLGTLWVSKWQDMKNNLSLAWIAIEGVWVIMKQWLDTTFGEALDTLKGAWETFWNFAQLGFMIVWDAIRPAWETIKEWFERTFPNALDVLKVAWDTAIGPLATPVDVVVGVVGTLFDRVREFWNWISSHVFTFQISIPDLPPWAIPDSPLPIHTAWKNFANEFNGKKIAVEFAPVASVTAPSVAMPAHFAAAEAGKSQSNTFGPNYINNGMDEAVFTEKVRRIVAGDM